MNKKSTQIGVFVVFLAVVGGALYYGMSGNSQNNRADAQPVQIIKYSDYQCPACKAYIPIQEELKREFGNNVEIEYRHFPLTGHRYAAPAAYAVEAARNQGKYKEMHDLIFRYQEVWSRGNAEGHFRDFAGEIGLDIEQFNADMESEEIINKVAQQREEGLRRQVNATPTFFINGERLQRNPQSYEQMKSIVELYMYRES